VLVRHALRSQALPRRSSGRWRQAGDALRDAAPYVLFALLALRNALPHAVTVGIAAAVALVLAVANGLTVADDARERAALLGRTRIGTVDLIERAIMRTFQTAPSVIYGAATVGRSQPAARGVIIYHAGGGVSAIGLDPHQLVGTELGVAAGPEFSRALEVAREAPDHAANYLIHEYVGADGERRSYSGTVSMLPSADLLALGLPAGTEVFLWAAADITPIVAPIVRRSEAAQERAEREAQARLRAEDQLAALTERFGRLGSEATERLLTTAANA
jgi:hypothetical protein